MAHDTSSDRGGGNNGSGSGSLSRLNAQAPEFVPRPLQQVYAPNPKPHFRPHLQRPRGAIHYFDPGFHHEFATAAADVADHGLPSPPALKNGVTEEAAQKIINQVEYYFSDINLATTDHLMKFINKEAEGYVPVSVVSSFKKIKAVINSNSQLASILRDSTKLVVSEDGKKVRRQHPLTESDLEELQSRIIIAENLPEDHCHQNLMKIFSAVGSVKTIRTCQPQPLNGGPSSASRPGKADSMAYSNKLHAFVEYESAELAEKAVAELNDEANWRSGLRVRSFLKNTGKSAQPPRGKKIENESQGNVEIGEKHLEVPSQQVDGQPREQIGHGEEHVNDKEGGGQKKGRARGKGKGRGGRAPSQHHNHHQQHHYHNNNHRVGTPPLGSFEHQSPGMMVSKQPPGPRMPDGTRGFTMGRGKPLLPAVGNISVA